MSFRIEPQKPLVPASIDFLLHCYCSCEPFPRLHAPFYQDLLPEWIEEGVIEPHSSVPGLYTATALGRAWVAALCNVNKPRIAYVDEHGVILT